MTRLSLVFGFYTNQSAPRFINNHNSTTISYPFKKLEICGSPATRKRKSSEMATFFVLRPFTSHLIYGKSHQNIIVFKSFRIQNKSCQTT